MTEGGRPGALAGRPAGRRRLRGHAMGRRPKCAVGRSLVGGHAMNRSVVAACGAPHCGIAARGSAVGADKGLVAGCASCGRLMTAGGASAGDCPLGRCSGGALTALSALSV